jgi:hypothetical protein
MTDGRVLDAVVAGRPLVATVTSDPLGCLICMLIMQADSASDRLERVHGEDGKATTVSPSR